MRGTCKVRKRWPKGTWMKVTSAETLKALMKQKGFTGARLARYAGCHESMISLLRSGRRGSCGDRLAVNIAEALGVPLEILFVPNMPSTAGQNVKRREAA